MLAAGAERERRRGASLHCAQFLAAVLATPSSSSRGRRATAPRAKPVRTVCLAKAPAGSPIMAPCSRAKPVRPVLHAEPPCLGVAAAAPGRAGRFGGGMQRAEHTPASATRAQVASGDSADPRGAVRAAELLALDSTGVAAGGGAGLLRTVLVAVAATIPCVAGAVRLYAFTVGAVFAAQPLGSGLRAAAFTRARVRRAVCCAKAPGARFVRTGAHGAELCVRGKIFL